MWRSPCHFRRTHTCGLQGRSDVGLQGRSDVELQGRGNVGLQGRSDVELQGRSYVVLEIYENEWKFTKMCILFILFVFWRRSMYSLCFCTILDVMRICILSSRLWTSLRVFDQWHLRWLILLCIMSCLRFFFFSEWIGVCFGDDRRICVFCARMDVMRICILSSRLLARLRVFDQLHLRWLMLLCIMSCLRTDFFRFFIRLHQLMSFGHCGKHIFVCFRCVWTFGCICQFLCEFDVCTNLALLRFFFFLILIVVLLKFVVFFVRQLQFFIWNCLWFMHFASTLQFFKFVSHVFVDSSNCSNWASIFCLNNNIMVDNASVAFGNLSMTMSGAWLMMVTSW